MTSPGGRDSGVNGVKAVLLIAVLLVLAIVVLARSAGHSNVATKASTHKSIPPTTVGSTTTSTPPTTVLPASQVKVEVLNGVLTGSLAGEWTTKLKANPGYQTLTPNNATAKVTASAIYVITPGYASEGDALAAAVGLPASAVNTTVPASAPIPTADRASANLVLVIGPDLVASA